MRATITFSTINVRNTERRNNGLLFLFEGDFSKSWDSDGLAWLLKCKIRFFANCL